MEGAGAVAFLEASLRYDASLGLRSKAVVTDHGGCALQVRQSHQVLRPHAQRDRALLVRVARPCALQDLIKWAYVGANTSSQYRIPTIDPLDAQLRLAATLPDLGSVSPNTRVT
jgi:hypothetical protein